MLLATNENVVLSYRFNTFTMFKPIAQIFPQNYRRKCEKDPILIDLLHNRRTASQPHIGTGFIAYAGLQHQITKLSMKHCETSLHSCNQKRQKSTKGQPKYIHFPQVELFLWLKKEEKCCWKHSVQPLLEPRSLSTSLWAYKKRRRPRGWSEVGQCVLSAAGVGINILDDVEADRYRWHGYRSSCPECPWLQLRERLIVHHNARALRSAAQTCGAKGHVLECNINISVWEL